MRNTPLLFTHDYGIMWAVFDMEGPIAMNKSEELITSQLAVVERYDLDTLRGRYREFFRADPARLGEDFMRSRIMHRVQELYLGGLNESELATIAAIQRKDDKVNSSARPSRKAPVRNVTYERTYKGQTYYLEHHGGNRYYMNGTLYKSLTAAATAITGTHLSGKAFWGIAE